MNYRQFCIFKNLVNLCALVAKKNSHKDAKIHKEIQTQCKDFAGIDILTMLKIVNICCFTKNVNFIISI